MLHTERYEVTDPDEVKQLIRNNPWATIVSHTPDGLIASHYPVLLDESDADGDQDSIRLVSHFGRPDDVLHELGQHEILVIIEGPNDYVSSSWYEPGDVVPTWDFMTVHLYGTPVLLNEDETYAILSELTDHFEQHYPGGRSLHEDESGSRKEALGAVGFTMQVERFQAKIKLSQNKPAAVIERIVEEYRKRKSPLADEMARRYGL